MESTKIETIFRDRVVLSMILMLVRIVILIYDKNFK